MVAVLIMSAGCAHIKDDTQRTQAEGAAVGAVGGAILGGLLAVATGNVRHIAAFAATGALLGGGIGLAYGNHVASKKKEYAQQEDWLDACVAEAEKVNQETAQYNATLAGEIQALETETNNLLAAYQEKKAEQQQLLAAKEKVDQKHKQAQDRLARVKFELECQQKVAEQVTGDQQKDRLAKLDQEKQTLQKQIEQLEAHTSSLASMSARMTV
jgi:hypothetical protein